VALVASECDLEALAFNATDALLVGCCGSSLGRVHVPPYCGRSLLCVKRDYKRARLEKASLQSFLSAQLASRWLQLRRACYQHLLDHSPAWKALLRWFWCELGEGFRTYIWYILMSGTVAPPAGAPFRARNAFRSQPPLNMDSGHGAYLKSPRVGRGSGRQLGATPTKACAMPDFFLNMQRDRAMARLRCYVPTLLRQSDSPTVRQSDTPSRARTSYKAENLRNIFGELLTVG
jgi:hypothetical protein